MIDRLIALTAVDLDDASLKAAEEEIWQLLCEELRYELGKPITYLNCRLWTDRAVQALRDLGELVGMSPGVKITHKDSAITIDVSPQFVRALAYYREARREENAHQLVKYKYYQEILDPQKNSK